ncbi:MAG: hypothetical protein AAF960_27795, partial [Bacteroidota bacterium]
MLLRFAPFFCLYLCLTTNISFVNAQNSSSKAWRSIIEAIELGNYQTADEQLLDFLNREKLSQK